jgi:hypothetical protein
MKRSTSRTKWAIGGTLPLVGMIVAVFACGGDFISTGPSSGKVKECPIVLGDQYPMNATIRVDKPAICPFNTFGMFSAEYAADATFAVGTTDRQVNLIMSDRLGYSYQVFIQAAWGTVGGSGDDEVQTSGSYWAAEGGFAQDANGFYTNGFDNAHNRVLVFGQWREAIATLNYNYGAPGLEVNGPTNVGAGGSYTLDVEVKDANMVPPVSYDWSVDGVPSSQTGTEYQGQLDYSGSSQAITVHSVDGNGLEHTAVHSVSSCPDHQVDC